MPRKGPARCVIVEDQRMFAELLATLLQASPDIDLEVSAAEASVTGGIAACELHRPDLLLLDIGLPDGSGMEVAERFQAVNPAGQIVIISGHAASFVCPKPLAEMVVAVIDKSDAFRKLQMVLHLIASQRQRSVDSADDQPLPRRLPLSAREREVLLLIGQGRTSINIAETLGISVHTVHVHRKKISAKLGIRGNELRLEAYRYSQSLESPSFPRSE